MILNIVGYSIIMVLNVMIISYFVFDEVEKRLYAEINFRKRKFYEHYRIIIATMISFMLLIFGINIFSPTIAINSFLQINPLVLSLAGFVTFCLNEISVDVGYNEVISLTLNGARLTFTNYLKILLGISIKIMIISYGTILILISM